MCSRQQAPQSPRLECDSAAPTAVLRSAGGRARGSSFSAGDRRNALYTCVAGEAATKGRVQEIDWLSQSTIFKESHLRCSSGVMYRADNVGGQSREGMRSIEVGATGAQGLETAESRPGGLVDEIDRGAVFGQTEYIVS